MSESEQTTLEENVPRFSRNGDGPGIRAFRNMVLSHYEKHGRSMAWRETTDPYRILVSEIMLQQTQVERVSVKYPLFIEAFPDFASLAEVPLSEVLAKWQGMGYNRRAIALQKCAIRVMTDYDGRLPADVDILSTFPGIGKATASSVCAFAFNMPVIFIETNIRRVFIHFFFHERKSVHDTDILPLVESTLYRRNPCLWYNALMDLGTALKKTVPNPNRRSLHYAKQSAFEGSDREIRGRILKLLVSGDRVSLDIIENHFPGDPARIARIVASLEREGFIRGNGTHWVLSS